MEFTFKNYKLFCYDFKLKPNRFKNLKYLKNTVMETMILYLK